MKILHVDTGREMRGGQYQALMLARRLVQLGHENTLLARPDGFLWQAAKSVKGLNVGSASLAEIWRHSKAADVVHAHDAQAHTLSVMVSRRPVVVSRRVAFPIRRSFLSRVKYRRATRFLTVSRFVAAQLRVAGIDPKRIDVVYDSVEPAEGAEPIVRAEGPIIALASRDPLKGRRVLEQVARQFDIPIVFSSDLAQDLTGAAVFVYISESEGLGSAALLAMARCVPVIASRVGGLPEVVEHEVTGLLVDNNATEIAAAITRLRNDSSLAGTLCGAAYGRVQSQFSVERMVESTLNSYAKAIRG